MLEMFSVLCWKELWTETLSENESTAMLHRCGVFSAAGLFFFIYKEVVFVLMDSTFLLHNGERERQGG